MANTDKDPAVERKPDLSKNNSDRAKILLAELKEKEITLCRVPLRLNDKTIAMVNPCERNTKKAYDLKKKYNIP